MKWRVNDSSAAQSDPLTFDSKTGMCHVYAARTLPGSCRRRSSMESTAKWLTGPNRALVFSECYPPRGGSRALEGEYSALSTYHVFEPIVGGIMWISFPAFDTLK
jgi:hypothetical protein